MLLLLRLLAASGAGNIENATVEIKLINTTIGTAQGPFRTRPNQARPVPIRTEAATTVHSHGADNGDSNRKWNFFEIKFGASTQLLACPRLARCACGGCNGAGWRWWRGPWLACGMARAFCINYNIAGGRNRSKSFNIIDFIFICSGLWPQRGWKPELHGKKGVLRALPDNGTWRKSTTVCDACYKCK